MKTKMTFQPRTVGLLVTVLLAAGLFSGCSDPVSADIQVRKQWPKATVYRLPESPRSNYVVVDSCGAVWYTEVIDVFDPVEVYAVVSISPCR